MNKPKFSVGKGVCSECGNFKGIVEVQWPSGDKDRGVSPQCYVNKEDAHKASLELVKMIELDYEMAQDAINVGKTLPRQDAHVKKEYLH